MTWGSARLTGTAVSELVGPVGGHGGGRARDAVAGNSGQEHGVRFSFRSRVGLQTGKQVFSEKLVPEPLTGGLGVVLVHLQPAEGTPAVPEPAGVPGVQGRCSTGSSSVVTEVVSPGPQEVYTEHEPG